MPNARRIHQHRVKSKPLLYLVAERVEENQGAEDTS